MGSPTMGSPTAATTPAVDTAAAIAFPYSGLPFGEELFRQDFVSTAQHLSGVPLPKVPKDFVYDDTADEYTITWSYPGCI